MPSETKLTHVNARGEAHMVDVGDKQSTKRRAVAGASLTAQKATLDALFANALKKGDALATARIAGIMGAKRTADLIPLCHPLALTHVDVAIERRSDTSLSVRATAETKGQTGVEMEALTAVSVAALTLYDMAKAIDRGMTISQIALVEKEGGKSGTYKRQEG